MFTACPGNFGSQNIFGGFSYGKVPVTPVQNPAKKSLKEKKEESGPRLKQRTVVTEYMTGTKGVSSSKKGRKQRKGKRKAQV